GGYPSFGFAENTDDLFVGKTLLHGDVLMWLMKTLLTSGCTNQRGAGHYSTSYTKCMINMVCGGEKFTFEYEESFGEPAPFIAKGDKAKLYWYGTEHEVIPRDREDITYGIRLICLYNITTDNFYESRMCNEPGNVFKVVQRGGQDLYKHYSQC
ncbi:hypothetical protein, partial [Enterobacter roggenkampii]|uniref:hypothetical protein n=1 Tax=Enterobacter roggenkampii TaxID=1812935 RepID=UPI000A0EE6C1